ncbi:hypothetical protein [Acinetobacter gerneri]|uniref:hypothetical protein n=1 Tax=Acinetobacter gerneri TaxID=202952 RepID=UPI0028ACB08F|nr:hypothetical protein [Acinetobacter gerneri]
MNDDVEFLKFKRQLSEFIQGLNKPEPKPQPDAITSAHKLQEVFLEAENEIGVTEHHVPGFEPKLVPKPAMASIELHLGTDLAPLAPQIDGIERNVTVLENESFILSAAVANAARTVQAGAKLIIADEKYIGSTSGMHVFQHDAAKLRVIEAADFTTVGEGSEVTASALPFTNAAVSWRGEDQKHIACRFTVSRRTRKAAGNEGIEYDIMTGIVLGLAKAVDKALFDAITALTPASFTIGAASARNITYGELQGFIGTAGTGASVQNCNLFAGGLVPAELTAETEATVIGAFNRVGVAINPHVNVVVERLNAQSDLNITVFSDIQAVLPEGSKSAFWSVAG